MSELQAQNEGAPALPGTGICPCSTVTGFSRGVRGLSGAQERCKLRFDLFRVEVITGQVTC